MKKILSVLCFIPLFMACSDDAQLVSVPEESQEPETPTQVLPATQVFVQGQALTANYKWPQVNAAEGWEVARFSIRADGHIPGYIDQSSALYIGRAPGKVGNNKGKVYTAFAYGHYNDRDLDYYQKDKKTGYNIGLFRYVYDENGLKTQPAIMEAPTVAEIMQDEKDDCEAILATKPTDSRSLAVLAQIADWEALEAAEPGYLDKHVLWYVVKEVGMKDGWHVNGVIVDYEVPSYTVDQVPDNLEVDIHQQVHQDWNEIKTSIHVRADVGSVVINLPIKEADILEQDDFDIRIYDYYYKDHVALKQTITHNADGITIELTDIDADFLNDCKSSFGDGITVEIHSYYRLEADVWEELKKSAVVSTGKNCTVNGQITSAVPGHDEVIPITIMQPKGN